MHPPGDEVAPAGPAPAFVRATPRDFSISASGATTIDRGPNRTQSRAPTPQQETRETKGPEERNSEPPGTILLLRGIPPTGKRQAARHSFRCRRPHDLAPYLAGREVASHQLRRSSTASGMDINVGGPCIYLCDQTG
jgi:hypothetical protein